MNTLVTTSFRGQVPERPATSTGEPVTLRRVLKWASGTVAFFLTKKRTPLPPAGAREFRHAGALRSRTSDADYENFLRDWARTLEMGRRLGYSGEDLRDFARRILETKNEGAPQVALDRPEMVARTGEALEIWKTACAACVSKDEHGAPKADRPRLKYGLNWALAHRPEFAAPCALALRKADGGRSPRVYQALSLAAAQGEAKAGNWEEAECLCDEALMEDPTESVAEQVSAVLAGRDRTGENPRNSFRQE